MSLKTNEEYEQKRNKQVARTRAVLDFIMGTVIIFIGLFLLLRSAFPIALNKLYPPDIYDKIYGVVAILYGSWRIYRGYKRNYFK